MKKLIMLLAALTFLCAQKRALTEQEIIEKAKKIHEKIFTIDTHNDTPMRLDDERFDISVRNDVNKGGSKVDFPRMKEGGLDAAFFAVFIGQGKRDSSNNARAINETIKTFGYLHSTVEKNKDIAEIATSVKDGYRIEKAGKRAVYIGIENGYALGNDLSLVKKYYDLGARYITLCHTKNNDICDSSTDEKGEEHNGVSEFGEKVIKEMNRLGILIDISHASDKSFYDAIKISKTPVIASHSCARVICEHPRNLNDEMLKALKKNGGVIQMCILSAYVKTPDPNPVRDSAYTALRKKWNNWEGLTDVQRTEARKDWFAFNEKFPQKLADVKDVVDHIDHIVKVAGIDHVGIGTDFDGGGGVNGCFDVSEMGNITTELVRRGYTEKQIKKIWGGNFMRVFKKVEEFAGKKKGV